MTGNAGKSMAEGSGPCGSLAGRGALVSSGEVEALTRSEGSIGDADGPPAGFLAVLRGDTLDRIARGRAGNMQAAGGEINPLTDQFALHRGSDVAVLQGSGNRLEGLFELKLARRCLPDSLTSAGTIHRCATQ